MMQVVKSKTFLNGKAINVGDDLKHLILTEYITKDEASFLVVNGFIETIEDVIVDEPTIIEDVIVDAVPTKKAKTT